MDIIRVDRIRLAVERSGQGFIERIFSGDEVAAEDLTHRRSHERLAVVFALKESVIKALGGLRPGMRWTDIRIMVRNGREVTVRLAGATRRRAVRNGMTSVMASASCRAGVAVAMAVGLGREVRP